jgi:tetratricopeptide (TPR) repeat protein
MKQNLTQSNLDKIIISKSDYNEIINSGEGLYRYSGLNSSDIYFNDNIQRLVQNYRIGFIRLAQNDIKEGNYSEAEKLISMMDKYFPQDMLDIEPGLVVLISDSIYGASNNNIKQLDILKRLFNKEIDIQTEIYLLHKLAELNDIDFVKNRATVLYTEKSDNLNFELQKYIGDILSDNLESADFISYCNKIFKNHKPIGLLYSVVRVYDELGESEKAISLIQDFLDENPDNIELIQLYDYLIQVNSIN